MGETVDQISANELTVSIFRESYPREMFEAMKNLGLEIEEHYPGIYYISGKQAMTVLKIPESDRGKYSTKL